MFQRPSTCTCTKNRTKEIARRCDSCRKAYAEYRERMGIGKAVSLGAMKGRK